MKIGVSAFAWTTTFTERHLGLLTGMREQGISCFEIAMFNPASLPVAGLRRAFEESGLEASVCAILPAGINPIDVIKPEQKKAKEHLLRCIDTAAEFGARVMCGPVYAPIGYLPGRRRNADEWAWAVECMQGLGDALDAHEMTLAVEPVNRSETFLLNTAAEALEFCKAVGHARVGITLDTFHANIEEKNLPDAVRLAGMHLKHMHMSENDRGLLGSGHVDFSGIVSALSEAEYDGCLMIEGFGFSPDEPHSLGSLWGDLNVSPEDVAFRGAEYLRGLLRSS